MPNLVSAVNKALPLRGVNAALQPRLLGATVFESEAPFTLAVPSAPAGKLAARVVRSSASGLLDFYYRLAMSEADYDDAIRLNVAFALHGLAVTFADFRLDGPGTIPPNYFESAPREPFAFRFDYGLSVGRDSRWCFVSTNAREFRETGGIVKLVTGKTSTSIDVPSPIALAATTLVQQSADTEAATEKEAKP